MRKIYTTKTASMEIGAVFANNNQAVFFVIITICVYFISQTPVFQPKKRME